MGFGFRFRHINLASISINNSMPMEECWEMSPDFSGPESLSANWLATTMSVNSIATLLQCKTLAINPYCVCEFLRCMLIVVGPSDYCFAPERIYLREYLSVLMAAMPNPNVVNDRVV